MLSYFKSVLWDSWSRDERNANIEKKLEEEIKQLTVCGEKSNIIKSFSGPTDDGIPGIRKKHRNANNVAKAAAAREPTDCFKKHGIVTTLRNNFGFIDGDIYFNFKVVPLPLINEIKVGSHVEYLAYRQENTQIKVVKIERVIDKYWDEEITTEDQLQQEIIDVEKENPTEYYTTTERSLLGVVTESKPESITVDTDFKLMKIELDSVEMDFQAKEGDHVIVCCKVQRDEGFFDGCGEVLDAVSVHAERADTQKNCVVQELHSDWGVLDKNCYFYFDILPADCKLIVGKAVCATLIACAKANFQYRCTELKVMDEVPTAKLATPAAKKKSTENHAVTVPEGIETILSAIGEEKELEVSVTSNCNRALKVINIEVLGRRYDSQLELIDPQPGCGFDLPGHSTRVIRMKAVSKFFGQSRQVITISFENFRIKRSVTIIVCEDESALSRAKCNSDLYMRAPKVKNNNQQRSRQYANEVWSQKRDIIPGVTLMQKRRFLSQRIEMFEVPERLRLAYLTLSKTKEIRRNIESMLPCLQQQLTMDNYSERFHALLHLEEIEQFVNFRNYDKERAHFSREGEYLSLVVENLAERRPSLVVGDIVRTTSIWHDDDSSKSCYDGVIHKVLFDRLLLKFNSIFQSKYNGEDYRLEFYFSRFSLRKQHYAVNRIQKLLGANFLFPTELKPREEVQLNAELRGSGDLYVDGNTKKWYNSDLNEIQKRAVVNILRNEFVNAPYIIFGPPGTGKTLTLVETILQLTKLVPGSRLLVGSPSNSSADLIATRLVESKELRPGDFIRLVSQNQVEKDLIPDHLTPYCATVDIGASGTCENEMIVTESGLKLRCQVKFMGRHKVTISTCSTLGNFIQMGFPENHFTHVLIDEAGQCTEPEIMVPICQISKTRGQIVLAGDPKQLDAIVTSKYAGEAGLSLSFLERILNYRPYADGQNKFASTSGFDPRLVTKLLYNYRALPSILHIYNELFYKADLRAVVSATDSREAQLLQSLDEMLPPSDARNKTHGLFFYGVRSTNMQEKDSPSWYNPAEARNVFLMTVELYKRKIQPTSIGIITPYTKQVKHLRNLFFAANIDMPKIGSVEEFQGQERDIILISTVRSAENKIVDDLRLSLGFVQCPKRMNVAISRSRYLMFVFGNPHLLKLDKNWSALIQYCVDNDAYLGCDLPDSLVNRDAQKRTNPN